MNEDPDRWLDNTCLRVAHWLVPIPLFIFLICVFIPFFV